jgi:RNA exonuclease NGL2
MIMSAVQPSSSFLEINMKRTTYEPTPEQIAQADKKRLKRLEKKLQQEQEESQRLPPGSILARSWISLSNASQLTTTQSVKVMTWNVRTSL